MSSLGIPNLNKDDFIHVDKTIIHYMKSKPKYKKVFVLSGEPLKAGLREIGLTVEDGVSLEF